MNVYDNWWLAVSRDDRRDYTSRSNQDVYATDGRGMMDDFRPRVLRAVVSRKKNNKRVPYTLASVGVKPWPHSRVLRVAALETDGIARRTPIRNRNLESARHPSTPSVVRGPAEVRRGKLVFANNLGNTLRCAYRTAPVRRDKCFRFNRTGRSPQSASIAPVAPAHTKSLLF